MAVEKLRIQALNEKGMERFRDWLEANGPRTTNAPPRHLIYESDLIKAIEDVGEIEAKAFENKFELGMDVAGAMGGAVTKLFGEIGVWPWLSLYYADLLFPKSNGDYFVGKPSRHIISKDTSWASYSHAHRHLVRSAVFFVSRYKHKARCFLDCRPNEHSKFEEQIASRKSDIGLDSCYSIISAIYKLYFDQSKLKVRRGAKGTGDGSIIRVIDIVRQLDMNYDLHSITESDFIKLLPDPEFARWKERLHTT